MDEQLLIICHNLEQVMTEPFDEARALQFFDQLSPADYIKLSQVFEQNDFEGLSPATKDKLLKILSALQNSKKS
jgi:hypothetical protein